MLDRPAIRAHLFGSLALLQNAEPLHLPGTRVARSLLAYLLLNRQRLHLRSVLLGVFWPDLPESRARRALTQALWNIGRVLPEVIRADADRIHIPDSLWVDVAAFEELVVPHLSAVRTGSLSVSRREQAIQDLNQGIQLYRCDLLESLYDDWVLLERERLRETYLKALECLIQLEKAAGHYDQALELALRLTGVEPLHEAAHREVMRLYVALEHLEEAYQQFTICRQVLKDELGVEPEPETLALAQEIDRRLQRPAIAYLPMAASVAPVSQLPLVGRERERAELTVHLEALASHIGGIVLVEGEAGVGKTRLMAEVARDANWRGIQVVFGHGRDLQAESPYGPLVEALESGLTPLRINQLAGLVDRVWMRALIPVCPAIGQVMADLAPLPTTSPAQDRARLFEAFAQCLLGWGQITSLVIILEDLHWADTDTLDLLISLVPHLCLSGVLVIGTFRGEDVRARTQVWERLQALDRAGVRHRVQLSRLDAAGTGELVRRSLGMMQAAPLFEARLFQETEGNPLFVLETLQALHDEGYLRYRTNSVWTTPWDDSTTDYSELPLPSVIERVIAQRLSRLGSLERNILNSASVLGSEFEFRLLQEIPGFSAEHTFSALNLLRQRRFLEETPSGYRFHHDKIRQVVYKSIAAPQCLQLHQGAAQAIERLYPERVTDLAHHYYQAHLWEKAIDYGQRAGTRAAAVYANREAAHYFSQALEALGKLRQPASPEQYFEIRLAREAVLGLLGERDAQLRDLIALNDLLHQSTLNTPDRRLMLKTRWASYYEVTCDFPAALKAFEEAVDQAHQVGDRLAETHATLGLGQLCQHSGKVAEAQAHLERAANLASAAGNLSTHAASLNALGSLFFNTGDYGQSLSYCQQALEICRPTDDQAIQASVYGLLGSIYHYMADYAASVENTRHALSVRRKIGDRRGEIMSLYNLSTVLHDSGNQEAARSTLEQVCELARAIDDRRLEGYGYVYLGLVLEYMGRLEDSRLAYAQGLALRRELGLHALAIDALSGLARVSTALDEHDLAVKYADEVLVWLEERGPDGVGDPCLAYQGAYQALLAAGKIRRGRAALRAAYQLLMTYADSISSPEGRQAYLHDINPGRKIWNDYQAMITRRAQVRLPRRDAPAGRRLRDDEYVKVRWTVHCPEDDTVPEKATRRRVQILRLLAEAEAQGAAPTIEDLAKALAVSRATVKRDLADLRGSGTAIRTRGGQRTP